MSNCVWFVLKSQHASLKETAVPTILLYLFLLSHLQLHRSSSLQCHIPTGKRSKVHTHTDIQFDRNTHKLCICTHRYTLRWHKVTERDAAWGELSGCGVNSLIKHRETSCRGVNTDSCWRYLQLLWWKLGSQRRIWHRMAFSAYIP